MKNNLVTWEDLHIPEESDTETKEAETLEQEQQNLLDETPRLDGKVFTQKDYLELAYGIEPWRDE